MKEVEEKVKVWGVAPVLLYDHPGRNTKSTKGEPVGTEIYDVTHFESSNRERDDTL